MQILEQFTGDQAELNLTEIAEKMKLSKPTVLRLAETLEQYGYLEREKENKKYKLGSKLFYLGSLVLNQIEIRDVALPIMKKIKDITEETIHLNIKEKKERICIGKVESNKDLKADVNIGQRSLLHAGASSKVLLAFQERKEIEEIVYSSYLKKITENTIIEPNKLLDELEKVFLNGYAFSKGERIEGVVSISVPIRDFSNKVIAGLSISIPNVRYSDEKFTSFLNIMLQGAKEISEKLGNVKEKK